MFLKVINQIANSFLNESNPIRPGDERKKARLYVKNYDLDRIFASGSERSKRTLWVNPQGFNQNRVKNRNKIIQISPNNFEELVRISNILETYGLVKCFSQTIIYSCHMLEISSSASFVKFLRKYERLNIELIFIDESERPLNFFSRLVREYVT